MNKTFFKFAVIAAAAVAVPMSAVSAVAQEAAAQHYSVRTTLIGTLLDDPAAAAILERLIPTVYANDMFKTMGRSQTLTAIQQYEPTVLSDAVLAQIQAEFDQLAAAE